MPLLLALSLSLCVGVSLASAARSEKEVVDGWIIDLWDLLPLAVSCNTTRIGGWIKWVDGEGLQVAC